MKYATAEPRRIIRAMVIAMVLPALAACSVLDDGTPGLKIKGSIKTQYGRSAKNCEVRLADLQGTWMTTYKFDSRIHINWASRYFYDADRGAYPGVNIEINCAEDLSAYRTISDAEMLRKNSNIDLGKIIVQ